MHSRALRLSVRQGSSVADFRTQQLFQEDASEMLVNPWEFEVTQSVEVVVRSSCPLRVCVLPKLFFTHARVL